MKKGSTLIDILVVITIIGCIAFTFFWPYFECHSKAEKQGLECSWDIIQGCMVNIDGKWIDYDRIRIVD